MENLEKLLQVSAKLQLVTPEIAKNWLTLNSMNRNISEVIVRYYASMISNGTWTLSNDAICFSDTHKLLNGQHRLKAIIMANKPIYVLVAFNYPEDSFKNMDKGKKRSFGDVFKICGIKSARLVSSAIIRYYLLKNDFSSALSGTFYTSRPLAELKISVQDALDIYYEAPEFWDEIGKAADRFYSKWKYFGQTEYAAYMAFLMKEKKHTQEKVYDFFTQLSSGGIYIKNQSIALLRDRITENAISKVKMTAPYRDALIVKTWNAFVLNKELKKFRYDNEKIDVL